jgi:hypothetical protein
VLRQRLTQPPKKVRSVAQGISEDLAGAIDRCLERDPANRWADAKSLRLALAPTDDEGDDPLLVRNFRIAVLILSLITPTFVSTAAFAYFYPGLIRRVAATLSGFVIFPLVICLIASVQLLRQGFGLRAIVQAAFRQPRGWRLWYPRRFRRRGDVFDRLPPSVSRVRLHFALLFGFIVGIYMPLLIGSSLALGAAPFAGVQFVPIFLVVLLFLERRRAVKRTAALLGIGSVEASRILSTPTWRTSVWQRDPAAKLLRRETAASRETPVQSPVTPTAPMNSDDRPTIG